MIAKFKLWIQSLFNQQHGVHTTRDPQLSLGEIPKPTDSVRHQPDADVHKLMIKATSIRKSKGYGAAIVFLKDLVEAYIREGNTALVVSVNKLIPYMKRDDHTRDEDIRAYLQDIISRAPGNDPYFLNLHITMARYTHSVNRIEAMGYLKKILESEGYIRNTYDLQIELIEMYIEDGELDAGRKLLEECKQLLNPGQERYDLIKKERKWHRASAHLAFQHRNPNGFLNYLFHRFVEFSLDMARVLDPMHIENFHKRKDLYYKMERGFVASEPYIESIRELGLEDKQDALLRDIYGFCFEEMPNILGVSEKVLNYRPGDMESLEELREKKVFFRKPFNELPELESRILKILHKYTG
jgi:hypothetical protein